MHAHLKVFFADNPNDNDPPKLYIKSKWRPPLDEIPQEVDTRICNFFREINHMFKRKPATSNLLPSQQKLITWLKNHTTWLVASTDKNLGPCVIEITIYIHDALLHLQDASTYATITEDEAAKSCEDLYRKIIAWTVEGRKKKNYF